MIKRDYLTFDELLRRWNCETRDLHYLISRMELVPSIVWRDPTVACKWTSDDEGGFVLSQICGEDEFTPIIVRLNSWVYLRLPTVTGPHAYYFSYASREAHSRLAPDSSDEWFRLMDSFSDYRAAEIYSDWLEANAVFMMDVVEACETVLRPELSSAFQNAAPSVDCDPIKDVSSRDLGAETLSTRERTTLLNIIALLADEAKIDWRKTSKAASLIMASAEKAGIAIGQRTIEEHLKRIPDSLERRTKPGK